MDRRSMPPLVVLIGTLAGATAADAATLQATVHNEGGEPVEDAVVYAVPVGADGEPVAPPQAVVEQVDKEYVPYVTAVPLGTAVSFPNHDQIRHHVYSFSEAKQFEIPLYKGTPAEPIVFDQPGPVTLGCNIHDWMTAYVFVAETPFVAVTEADGTATVPDLPAGDYAVRVWHPRMRGEPESTSQRLSIGGDTGPSVAFTIEEKRVWRPRRAPSSSAAGGYR